MCARHLGVIERQKKNVVSGLIQLKNCHGGDKEINKGQGKIEDLQKTSWKSLGRQIPKGFVEKVSDCSL